MRRIRQGLRRERLASVYHPATRCRGAHCGSRLPRNWRGCAARAVLRPARAAPPPRQASARCPPACRQNPTAAPRARSAVARQAAGQVGTQRPGAMRAGSTQAPSTRDGHSQSQPVRVDPGRLGLVLRTPRLLWHGGVFSLERRGWGFGPPVPSKWWFFVDRPVYRTMKENIDPAETDAMSLLSLPCFLHALHA